MSNTRKIGDSSANIYGEDGLILEEAGEIVTDRFGLSTGTCVYKAPKDKAVALANSNLIVGTTAHPHASYMTLDKRSIILTPGHSRIVCEFAGVYAASDWQYEFESGVKELPIQAHPSFLILAKRYGVYRQIYGSRAGMELNFAPEYNWSFLLWNEFVRFQQNTPLAGVDSFIDFANGIYRATRTTNTRPTELLGEVGTIMTPPGEPPVFTDSRPYYQLYIPKKTYQAFGGWTATRDDIYKARLSKRTISNRNWLYMGPNYTQRGSAFVETHQWLLSGPGGWNEFIYREAVLDIDEDDADGDSDYPEPT